VSREKKSGLFVCERGDHPFTAGGPWVLDASTLYRASYRGDSGLTPVCTGRGGGGGIPSFSTCSGLEPYECLDNGGRGKYEVS